jgi:hypothetical protein
MIKFTSDSLKWEGQNPTYRLLSADMLLLELIYVQDWVTKVKINDRWFEIHRDGFWNPIYSISESEQILLQLKHQFWGSKAIIKGPEEEMELSYIKDPFLSLVITKGEEKVLNYVWRPELNASTFKLELGAVVLDADLLLLLISLCFILSKDIAAEYQIGTSDDQTQVPMNIDA